MENPPEDARPGCSAAALGHLLIIMVLVTASLLLVARPSHSSLAVPREGDETTRPLPPPRKLLLHQGSDAVDEPSRLPGGRCTRGDIVVIQGASSSPLPSGIPAYAVEIINMCPDGCAISGIHLSCGWFSSAHLVNPSVFRRLRYDDCLVNNGRPLLTRETLSFLYASTYPYPLSVSSVSCS